MTAMTTMLRAAALSSYRELVVSLGGKPDPILGKYHIRPKTISATNGLVPLHSFVHLLEDTARKLDCPDFGLRLAAIQDADFLGPLAVGMRNAETLADGMKFISCYLFVHSPGVSLSITESNKKGLGFTEIQFAMTLPNIPVTRQVHDLGLGNTHQIMRLLTGEKYRPVEVHIPHKPTVPVKTYQKYFGVPVRVDQPAAKIMLRQKIMRMPIVSANPLVRKMAEHYLISLYPVPGQSLASRVKVAINNVLATRGATKTEIAKALAMHPRTLCKRLSAEDTTFECLRDEVRKETASNYLRSTQMPLSQIVGLLGLSEQAVLTRLCRRWFGETPSAIRKSLDTPI